MQSTEQQYIAWLVVGLGLGLLSMGALRRAALQSSVLAQLSGYATGGYVVITVVFAILLMRAGLPLNQFGFGIRPSLSLVLPALGAIVVLRLIDVLLNPRIESLIGEARNLERFADVKGSPISLVGLLVMNWSFAAFGEELAYRIVLMRGISFVLGDSGGDTIFALALQAVLFGLVHAYQGTTGIVGSTISGLVFGAVTIASGWSIWPAAIAHGVNNTIGIIELYRRR